MAQDEHRLVVPEDPPETGWLRRFVIEFLVLAGVLAFVHLAWDAVPDFVLALALLIAFPIAGSIVIRSWKQFLRQ